MKNIIIKNKVSSSWKSGVLGDVVEKIEGGGTPSKETPEYWGGSIPWASVKDIVTHDPKNTQDHITEEGLENSASRLVKAGTLIVPTRMALGHAVTFDVDVAINQDLKALYPKESLQRKYLYYWFQSKKRFIERLGSGSTVVGVQISDLRSIKFDLPPKPEQDRIVAVLETWDQAIEKMKRKIEIKKEVKRGLMQELLSGKRRLPGYSDKWTHTSLGQTCKFFSGFPFSSQFFSSEAGIRVIRNRDLKNNDQILYYVGGEIPEVFKISNGDILVGMDGDFIACRWFGGEALLNQRVGKLTAFKAANKDFLFYKIQTPLKVIEQETSSTTVKHLSAKVFEKFKIELPSKPEQDDIANIITLSDEEIIKLESKLHILIDQKRYLLNNLITGTIRTSETLSTK